MWVKVRFYYRTDIKINFDSSQLHLLRSDSIIRTLFSNHPSLRSMQCIIKLLLQKIVQYYIVFTSITKTKRLSQFDKVLIICSTIHEWKFVYIITITITMTIAILSTQTYKSHCIWIALSRSNTKFALDHEHCHWMTQIKCQPHKSILLLHLQNNKHLHNQLIYR